MPDLTIGLIVGFGLAMLVVLVMRIARGSVRVRSGTDAFPIGDVQRTVHRTSIQVHQHPDGRVVVEREGETHEYASMDEVPDDVRQMMERVRQLGPGTHVTTERIVRREPPV